MTTVEAVGWPAGWLPGWLAALGITQLIPDARLAWTEEAAPHAVIEIQDRDPWEAIAAAVPSEESILGLTIARQHPESDLDLTRTVTIDAWKRRAALARRSADGSLESTLTDLANEPGDALGHGPLDPPAPKGLTIHERLLAMRQALPGPEQLPAAVRASLSGATVRVPGNGLGLDPRRLPASVQGDSGPRVDPLVEVLAFSGMGMFPVRGSSRRVRQRGWTAGGLDRGSFTWPAWSAPLSWWAIDALLDQVYSIDLRDTRRSNEADQRRRTAHRSGVGNLARISVHALFASVSQQPRATTDVMRAIASERIL